ncbi:hypothetical protein LJR030_000521 [Rhizobium sp. LjRoot30]|uniref:hypothetical protein n=1 Tax=Rhizobium sp. LjRoot30 TaxID=3342320 RepID=UPI003ECEA599
MRTLPDYWAQPTFDAAASARIADVAYDTFFAWQRLARAMGFKFGDQRRRYWSFRPADLYALLILAALSKLGVPIGMPQIKAVFHFTFDEDGKPRAPPGPFVQLSADERAWVQVDALRIFDDVVAGYIEGVEHA